MNALEIVSLALALFCVFTLAGFFTSIFHANNQLCRIIYAKMSANSICTMLDIPCEALTNYRIVAQYSIVLVSPRSTSTHHSSVLRCVVHHTNSFPICEQSHTQLANSAVLYVHRCLNIILRVPYPVYTFSSWAFASQVILRRSSIEYQWN